jgi:hypothetical protein
MGIILIRINRLESSSLRNGSMTSYTFDITVQHTTFGDEVKVRFYPLLPVFQKIDAFISLPDAKRFST